MVIFTDPERDHQVMALYTHDTTSTVWAGLGYERREIPENRDISRLGRDCYVVWGRDGELLDVVERVNHIRTE